MRISAHLGRRAVAVAAAATVAIGLAGCGSDESTSSPDKTAETPKLTIGVTPVGDFAPIYYAKEKGIFEKNGLDVEIRAKDTSEVPALLSGSWSAVSMSWNTFIQAVGQNVPLRGVFPGINGAPGTQTGIYVMGSSGITAADQLVGKDIAIDQPKATLELNSRFVLDEAGVDDTKVGFQTMPFPTLGDALVAGKSKAAYLVPPFSTQAEAKGAKLLVDAYGGELAGAPIAGYVMTADFIEKNPEAVKAFQKSLAEAADALNKPGAYVEFVPTFTKLTPELAQKVPVYQFPTSIDVDKLQFVADLMADKGYAEKKVTIKDVINNP